MATEKDKKLSKCGISGTWQNIGDAVFITTKETKNSVNVKLAVHRRIKGALRLLQETSTIKATV